MFGIDTYSTPDNPPPLMRYMKKLLAENKITEKVYNKLARENAIRILGL
jgi:hypothetical protein